MRVSLRVLGVSVLLLTAGIAFGQTGKIQVAGTGRVGVPGTTMTAMADVYGRDGTLESAKSRSEEVVRILRDLDIPAMTIEERELAPGERPATTGGRGGGPEPRPGVRLTLRVEQGELSFTKIHQMVLDAGTIGQWNVQAEWEDTAKWEPVVVKKAIEDAKAKAAMVAEGAGVTIKGYEYMGFVPQNGSAPEADAGIRTTWFPTGNPVGHGPTAKTLSCTVYLVATY